MTFTFTSTELYDYTQIIQNLQDYKNTYDTLPEYEEWLETTFGEDWLDYHMDFDAELYQFEWCEIFYYGLVTGKWSDQIKEWVKERKEYINECLAEQE